MATMTPFARVEDDRLVRGRGRFTADLVPRDALHAIFVRAPHAHARIVSLTLDDARAMPDIVAVIDAAMLDEIGVQPLSETNPVPAGAGNAFHPARWPALARGKVRYVGEAVALVLATTLNAALDAAEAVVVEYDECVAAIGVDAALAADAPLLHDAAPGNVASVFCVGDKDGVTTAFARAAHVVAARFELPRVVAAPMEPRSVLARFDAATGVYTLTTPSQGVGALRRHLAPALGVAPEALHILTQDVGGAFGARAVGYPEHLALLAAAHVAGRPVRWTATRLESMTGDTQGRGMSVAARLALDAEGNFLSLDIDNRVDLGAYNTSNAAFIASNNFARSLVGPYRTPLIAARVTCVLSNAAPVAAYRGAGRPEGNYIVERLIDLAARRCGFDRIALRRRNMIAAQDTPYTNALGFSYDSGDFRACLDAALTHVDLEDFERRKRVASDQGRLLGLGLCCFVEPAGGPPQETAHLRFGDGVIFVDIGGQSIGTSHATVFRALAARLLDLDETLCEVRQGDSARHAEGAGSIASRSAVANAQALGAAVDVMLVKARRLASLLLQAAPDDLVYRRGLFTLDEDDRGLDLFELDRAARDGTGLPDDLAGGLDTRADVAAKPTFPNGCHIAEVEIDGADGQVRLTRYVSVDDCGVVLDEAIVAGQIHGGVAQAMGEALCEIAHYDPDSGQLVSASFMDYAMPRAADLVAFEMHARPTPCASNPLGLKGAGESGTTGGLAAIMNAVCDALSAVGVDHVDMPATPERVWAAMAGRARRPQFADAAR